MRLAGKTSEKEVISVAVDGTDLLIAHMGKSRGELIIHSLEQVTLPRRITVSSPVKSLPTGEAVSADGDVFGIEDSEEPMDRGFADSESEEHDISGILVNVFSRFPLKKAQIAVNIPEGFTSYYTFENDSGLKGKKLVKHIREEVLKLSGGIHSAAIINHIRLESGGITAVVSEGNSPLITELLDIKKFLPGMPRFCLVEPNELALVNLV
ncbi:MAG: hypothetical protein ABH878_06340, partial [bacterium]